MSIPLRRRARSALLAVLAAVSVIVVLPAGPAAFADAAGGGGDYVPLSGGTVLDTRNGTGGVTGNRGAASTTTVAVLGAAGVPTTGVGSVLIRVTALNPSAATWFTVFPAGTTQPNLTTLAVGAGQDLSNTSVVKVGANGKISVYNQAGTVGIVVEVHGYYKSAQGTAGGGFVAVPQTRVVDTRNGIGTTTGAIAVNATRTVTLAGNGVPAGASAVVVDLIVPGAGAPGWLNAAPVGGGTRNVMNYEAGSSQQTAVLTLPADGRVVFTNRGTVAVNLSIVVQGYYTNSATTGAGFRPVANRLVNTRTLGAGLPLAAGATLDVQVAGTNGLPTRGVAGAALDITVTPSTDGYLKAWPLGQPEPVLSVMDFTANRYRSNTLFLKPGTDGKIRIRNSGSGTAHVLVDLEGWYADPIPAVPVAQDTRVSVLQTAPRTGALAGTIEYAYVDNAGRVVYGHQPDVDNFGSLQWSVISGNEAFSGPPTVGQLADGRVQVAAQYRDSDIWADSQTAVGATTWNPWSDLGGSMASPPVTGKISAGTPVQFAADVDGRLWAYATGAWRDLGDKDLTAALTAVRVRDGIRVFGVDATGAVQTIEYYDDSSASAWSSLGGTGLTGAPAVVVRPGYQLQAFARGTAGTVVTKEQGTDGTWPADWQTLGTLTAAGAPAAILDPALGRLAVVARSATDGEIYHVWETATGANTWGDWTKTIAATDPSATDPTVASYINSAGQSWMIVFRTPNGEVRVYDRQLP